VNTSGRGGFGSGAVGGGTYGGVGYCTATVGGLWDALLGEGRRWFNFASSDYHKHWTHCEGDECGDDYYPGEYQKTWTYVVDENHDGLYSPYEIANALRSGNSFHVMGDLVNALEFTAESGSKQTSMGGQLNIKNGRWSKEPVVLTIRFKSPDSNTFGDPPKVDHIDLIAGDITGKIAPTSPDYITPANETAKVIATFTAADWHVDRDGCNAITYRIKDLDNNKYFRLRGTNMAPNTAGQTDAVGNPLLDREGPLSGDDEAHADLWFYSNPIFVYLK
jgi:hypothetical protein